MLTQLSLIFWIIGAPIVFAIIDLIGTFSAPASPSNSELGPWSRALHIGSANVAGRADTRR